MFKVDIVFPRWRYIFAEPGQSGESCSGGGGGGGEGGEGKMMCLVSWFATFVGGVVRVRALAS